jgi:rhamnose transport system permease protein
VVLVVCIVLGLVNGVLVVRFGLPSLAVTLGTMGAIRALALLFGGAEGYAGFDSSYIWLGSATWFGYLLPVSLVLLVFVFALLAVLMHGSVYGRLCYIVGARPEVARFSGIDVLKVKIAAFGFGGAMAALASLVYVGQYQSARADNATELLLIVVAAVTLGGVDIFGGRGRVLGVFLALILLGTLRNGMGLANLPGPVQTLVVGLLLVTSVLANQWVGQFLNRIFSRGHNGVRSTREKETA